MVNPSFHFIFHFLFHLILIIVGTPNFGKPPYTGFRVPRPTYAKKVYYLFWKFATCGSNTLSPKIHFNNSPDVARELDIKAITPRKSSYDFPTPIPSPPTRNLLPFICRWGICHYRVRAVMKDRNYCSRYAFPYNTPRDN